MTPHTSGEKKHLRSALFSHLPTVQSSSSDPVQALKTGINRIMAASADDIAYLGVITKAATALVSDSRVQATMHIMLSVGCAHHLYT